MFTFLVFIHFIFTALKGLFSFVDMKRLWDVANLCASLPHASAIFSNVQYETLVDTGRVAASYVK